VGLFILEVVMSLFGLAILFISISLVVGYLSDDGDAGGKVFAILVVVWFGLLIYRYNTDEEWAKERAEEAAARIANQRAEETPHVVREADGCKVYAFKSGDRWHFFTRCPNAQTVTDTAYEYCTGSGKQRSCKELHDSIETR
jgi:hypothetical protein